jgi:hypothetical protein
MDACVFVHTSICRYTRIRDGCVQKTFFSNLNTNICIYMVATLTYVSRSLGPPLWSEFLATDPEVVGLILGATSFLRSGGSRTGFSQPRNTGELLGRNISGSGLEIREYSHADTLSDHATP